MGALVSSKKKLAVNPAFHGFVKKKRNWGEFFRQFFRLAAPFWMGETKWVARWLSVWLIVLTIAQVIIPVAINFWSEGFFDALEQRSWDRFLMLSGVLVIIMVANVAIVTLHLRVKRRLQINWREWLTAKVVGEWMDQGHQYEVSSLPGEHDNPDGRIAEDVRIATEYAIDLAHSLFFCSLLLGSFTKILWSRSGPPEIVIGGVEFWIPGHLVWIAIVYAACGTFVAWWLGLPLVSAANRRQTWEANFRFGLVHARENALPIALLRGEPDERRSLLGIFKGTATAWDKQTYALSNLFLFTSFWSVLTQVFPVMVAAPRYIANTISLGVLMQTAQAFQQMVAALSWPIDNLGRVADWRASGERVLGLHEALCCLVERVPHEKDAAIKLQQGDRPVLEFHNVVITDPEGKNILEPFNLEIGQGERVLITGDHAAAFAVCKVVAGLWPWGRGEVRLPQDGDIFFMPQRPYLPIGPLHGAVCYPAPESFCDMDEMINALRTVDLGHLVDRMHEIGNWEQSLVAEEQQRLGFARLLLRRPRWVFIQEAADSLDRDVRGMMMQLIMRVLSDSTIITIGHHRDLVVHHARHLELAHTNGSVILEERPVGAE